MDAEASERFKAEVRPNLEAAIEANGGIERMRKIYGMMNGVVDFLAGWVACHVNSGRVVEHMRKHTVQVPPPRLTHEEIRRIYDLVRLRLDSESSTS